MQRKTHQQQVRIIGGSWRSRRVAFHEADGLRPTPDRVRETLFNWLTPYLAGARCLDLFAGSGALGFEAASRGAGAVTMVEQSTGVTRQLQTQSDLLKAGQVCIINSDARRYLAGDPQPFDIVFLDPPYDQPQLLTDCLAGLLAPGWLGPRPLVYLEARSGDGLPQLPPDWVWRKQMQAGQVTCGLAEPV